MVVQMRQLLKKVFPPPMWYLPCPTVLPIGQRFATLEWIMAGLVSVLKVITAFILPHGSLKCVLQVLSHLITSLMGTG